MKLTYLTPSDPEAFEAAMHRVARRDDELALVFGGSAPAAAPVNLGLGGFVLPLWGRLHYDPDNPVATVASGELRVAGGASTIVAGGGACLWLAIVASPAAWQRALAKVWNFPAPEPLLLSGTYAADADLRKDAVKLLRRMQRGGGHVPADAVIAHVTRLHRRLEAAIARCPGRTYSQRRQVFARLQRVRNYMATHCHLDLDNQAMAELANFSPSYFIRAFRDVFDQTPHAYLVARRLDRARNMLSTTPLGISEIAHASGFENRSAFARIFRKRFGTTAGAIRRSIGHALRASPPRETAIFAT
jgi:AraC family transcriptional regulator